MIHAPEEPSERPAAGPASTTRGYRLTARQRADLACALMLAIEALNPTCPRCGSTSVQQPAAGPVMCTVCGFEWDAEPDGNQGYRLRQLLEQFAS